MSQPPILQRGRFQVFLWFFKGSPGRSSQLVVRSEKQLNNASFIGFPVSLSLLPHCLLGISSQINDGHQNPCLSSALGGTQTKLLPSNVNLGAEIPTKQNKSPTPAQTLAQTVLKKHGQNGNWELGKFQE